jgi:hypothetical protein
MTLRPMAPIDLARYVYKREPCARTFEADLTWHLENGFVFSRPDFFVMGRPVNRHASPALIVGQYRFPSVVADCWHVYLMAGNVARAWSMLPWELEWVSFERGNVLRFHRLASIRRLSGGFPAQQPETIPSTP